MAFTRTRRTALLTALTVATINVVVASPSSAASAACVGSETIALTNAGFESPTIATRSYRIMAESNVPGWSTTAADGQIELWSSGFGGVPAAEGGQFAELNANMTSALYQDVPTSPGTRVTWSLAHRGRAGVDTMRVVIGRPNGTLVEVARMSNGATAWGRHSGTYVVPAGQTTTRFAFEAVSTAGGNPTIGNFLDDIAFGTPACVQLTKKVTVIGDPVPGGRLRWTVTATNTGGAPATGLTISDTPPVHTTYAAGSLRVLTGPRAGTLTDVADSDAGTVVAGRISWTPTGSSNIAGRLNPRESTSVCFETVIAAGAAGSQVNNRASAQYVSDGVPVETDSDQATVVVAEVADVYVHKLFDAAAVVGVAGTAASSFTIVVGNLGPFGADQVTATDPLPAGMSIDATAITIDGAAAGNLCSIAGLPAVLHCLLGDLPPGAMRTITVPASYTKTTPGIEVVENSVEAQSAQTVDIDPDNNLSTAQLVFDPGPAADVTVTVAAPTSAYTPGEHATWVIKSLNATENGLPATGVTTTLQLPSNLEDIELPDDCTLASSTTAMCTIGTLAALESRTFKVSGRIGPDVVEDTSLRLRATVAADVGSDSDATNNVDEASVTVTRPGHLEVRKVALDPVTQAHIRFEVIVLSTGEFEARDVTLTDIADAGAVAVAYPDYCTVQPDASLTCTLGTLETGASVTLLVEFTKIDYNSALTNTASAVGSNTGDPVSATAKALPIVPEYSERSLPGGLPPAPPPPPMAFTGSPGAPMLAVALLLMAAGFIASTRARRKSA